MVAFLCTTKKAVLSTAAVKINNASNIRDIKCNRKDTISATTAASEESIGNRRDDQPHSSFSPSRRPRVVSKSFGQLKKELLLVQSFQTCLGFRAPVRVSLTFRVLKNLRD
jgi:hypothetical protein